MKTNKHFNYQTETVKQSEGPPWWWCYSEIPQHLLVKSFCPKLSTSPFASLIFLALSCVVTGPPQSLSQCCWLHRWGGHTQDQEAWRQGEGLREYQRSGMSRRPIFAFFVPVGFHHTSCNKFINTQLPPTKHQGIGNTDF